jgi:26S proteasome non-ATPase regulatory subunit 10|tara:strand:+ start:1214 stop:1657 length:444 start_codon:yes stop_codon:yes gene_type:complete
VVTCLLAHGAHADASNSGGQRPAHYASSKGHLQILQKLHEIGADFHAADKTGATPLHRAASTGRVDLVTWIVEHVDAETKKNDLETKNKIGQTPIIVACEAGQDAAVLALARLGAAIDALDDEGNGVKKLAPKLWPVCVSIKQGDVE